MSEVMIQIVDEQDRTVRAGTAEEAYKKGLFHRVVRVMIETTNGYVLLQRRSRTPGRLYPGCWDNSVAGKVDFAESYPLAAERETREEIGVSGLTLQRIGYYQSRVDVEGRKIREFNTAYRGIIDPHTTELHFPPREVEELKWFSIPDMLELVAMQPDLCTHGLLDVVQRCYAGNQA